MRKLFKLVSVLLLVVLLASPLAACRPWESALSLVITVKSPLEGTTVTTSPVTVSGTLSKTGTVKVNGIAATRKGSDFYSDVKLNPGSNIIEIDAAAGQETANKKITVNYTPG